MPKPGFAFDGRGRLEKIETFTTKNGKDIVTLMLRVEGMYPQLVPVKFFGRIAEDAKEIDVGEVVEVTGRLGGRDWNGRVYGEIVGESIEVVGEGGSRQQELPGASGATPSDNMPESDSVPF